jgi:hypothetical protein
MKRTSLVLAMSVILWSPASASLFLNDWGVSYSHWTSTSVSGRVDFYTEDWKQGDSGNGRPVPRHGEQNPDAEAVYFTSVPSHDVALRVGSFSDRTLGNQAAASHFGGSGSRYHVALTTGSGGDPSDVAGAVPEPTTLLLFGSGVVGLGVRRLRRKR